MFEWKDTYNIGIPFIDEQHQFLFNIASKIHALLKDNYTTDKYDQIILLINELKDYTEFHFKTEEAYMQKINYKKFFTQKVEHDFFIEKLNSINIYEVDEDHNEYIEKMLDTVSHWIIDHILKKDKEIPSV